MGFTFPGRAIAGLTEASVGAVAWNKRDQGTAITVATWIMLLTNPRLSWFVSGSGSTGSGNLGFAFGLVPQPFDCAAFFRGSTPEQAQAVNELGTQHLASAARAASVKRFVFTSTGLVYGSNGGLSGAETPAGPAKSMGRELTERPIMGQTGACSAYPRNTTVGPAATIEMTRS